MRMPKLVVFVRPYIIVSALRTGMAVEVVRRRCAYTGTVVNRRRTCLFVIIAGTIRLPVDECRPLRRVYGDIPASRIGNRRSPFNTIVGTGVAICIVVSHYHAVAAFQHDATLPTD